MKPIRLTELFEQARAARAQDPPRKLAPDRHPVRDFFVADITSWTPKDDRPSMEHPIFALSKTPDRQIRHYEHNGATITVTPSVLGRATIWDKDVLIYAVSQLMEAANQGRSISRTVRLKAYDLLVATNRHVGGKNYERLKECLKRLAGTRIETNIATNGKRISEGFGLIDNWKIERSRHSDTMTAVEVTLNEWLFNAVIAREVLTLRPEYFRLDGGLERRLYEIARKHCGRQPDWNIGLELLRKKTGSTASIRKFRQLLKQTAHDNPLPEYTLKYDADTDQVSFARR